MVRRLQLQSLLENLMGDEPEDKLTVYHQQPPNLLMQYPCILYKRDGDETLFASNKRYHRTQRYQVTVIDSDPDSLIPEKVAALPLCKFDRFYTADNLNHDVFTLFF